MSEEIQSLLDKIEREGIAKAESEKEKILSAARSKADEIIESAKREAEEIKKAAEKEAELSSRRADEAIRQSSRDVIISLQHELLQRLARIVKRNVSDAMTPEFMMEIILQIASKGNEASDLKIILPKAKLDELQEKLSNSLAADLHAKPAIFADAGMDSGFKLGFKGEDLMLDFSDEAFIELICNYAGPRIAAILKEKNEK